MTTLAAPTRRRHPRGAGLAALLYVLTALFTPILHANSERLAGTATYEAHHSAQCLPLHDEAVCPTCGAHESIAAPGAVSLAFACDAGQSKLLPVDVVAPPTPQVSPPAARAPPRH